MKDQVYGKFAMIVLIPTFVAAVVATIGVSVVYALWTMFALQFVGFFAYGPWKK